MKVNDIEENHPKITGECIFPKDNFREGQKDAISKIQTSLEAGNNIIYIAPTGSGKTITLLSGLVPLLIENQKKCICLARTYDQNERLLDESQELMDNIQRKKLNGSFNALQLKSRDKMCLNKLDMRLEEGNPEEWIEKCKKLRSKDNCKYFHLIYTIQDLLKKTPDSPILKNYLKWGWQEDFMDLDESSIKSPNKIIASYSFFMEDLKRTYPQQAISSDDLIEFGKKYTICPYFLGKFYMVIADLITCNYQ